MPIVESQWATLVEQAVSIDTDDVRLKADLVVPEDPFGLVVFAVGDGLSRVSSRAKQITRELEELGLATLALDLTAPVEAGSRMRGERPVDTGLIGARLTRVVAWTKQQPELRNFPVGFFGAGTNAAAAINAAASPTRPADAVVCWGGHAELGKSALEGVRVPTLLISGDADAAQVQANETALFRLTTERKELILIPEGSTRFSESAELDVIADLASDWFSRYLILIN